MRIGVLGVGRIGAVHAATLAEVVDDLVLVDADPARAEGLARELGARTGADAGALLAGPDRVDGVVIASATSTHAALLRQAVEAGIPAFCEKPVAPTVPETVEVARLVRSRGVPVMVGFQRRSDPAYRALRDRLRSGALGVPFLFRLVVGDDAPPPPEYLTQSGGLFRDQSVHDVDVLRWLTGTEVVEVTSYGARLTGRPGFDEADDIDTAATLLRLDSGPLAVLTSSRLSGSGYDVRLEVAGSAGTAAVGAASAPQQPGPDGVAVARSPHTRGFVHAFLDAYRQEMADFLDVVAGRLPSPCTVEDGLAAVLVADAIDTARRCGRPTPVPALDDLLAEPPTDPVTTRR